jgi:hypothetical protein
LRHTDKAEEHGKAFTVHYWQIANVVPPNYCRLAIFSYIVPAEVAEADTMWPVRWRHWTGSCGPANLLRS